MSQPEKPVTINVYAYRREGYGLFSLSEFVASMAEIMRGIPAEALASAKVEIESFDSYGDHMPRLTVRYSRAETEAEMMARIHLAQTNAAIRRQQDLETLAALRARYPEVG